MKKIISIALAVMLVLSLALVASADGETGSITINGIHDDAVYEVYKLLDLESYNTTSGAYSYKVNSAWTGFFATPEALAYVSINDAGYVSWINGEDDASVSTFAKLALAYAETHSIAPVKSSTVPGDFSVTASTGKFTGLELGYYLVDTNVGALCGLTTTNPDAAINAKNGTPTIDKQVQEDATEQWGGANSADIGQTVNFRVTINVHAGAQNYVLHDKMSAGLTFDAGSVTATLNGAPVDVSNYTVKTEDLCSATDCTFEIAFTKAFCDSLKINDKLILHYSAMLNRNAVVAGDGNPNDAWLEYGEGHVTPNDQTITKTYGFDIVKTDSQNTLIDGAQFKIYDAANGGNEVGVVLMDDGVTYRRARADEQAGGLTVPIVVKDGKVRVVGFDNGNYYLEETEAPDGYNKLTARQLFTIADGNLDATFSGEIFSTGSGVHVVNKTGSMLPETGGMGTVLFITIGMLVVLGTGLLLVTKKRMSMIKD
ncbi:MAG: isopeptide-forming domain-containing fimbrial protein [Ruminococcaceae bacterium]|nr:isopeptide-forming domain-containing fimbrial protein [Oscillospiraceae bacterium]